MNWENAAKRLWEMLAQIDNLDDSCRFNNSAYRSGVRDVCRRRHGIARSEDGQMLTLLHSDDLCGLIERYQAQRAWVEAFGKEVDAGSAKLFANLVDECRRRGIDPKSI